MPTATILAWLTNGWYIYMKTWSQSCHSFHSVKALASPKLSKRATPKAPRLCTYIESTLDNKRQNRPKPIRAVYNTPHEAFPLLCSWQLLLELPDSYTVKTKAYSYALYVYMSAQPLPIGASGMGIDVTKITLLSRKQLCLTGKVLF